MDQIKQIDQNQDNNINTQELLDAIKPNGFLSNENNLEEVGKLLNNEELNDGDKELLNSLTNTIDEEINRIIESGKVTEEDTNLINVWKNLLGENDERVQKLEELISQENNEGINNEDEINTTSENIIQQKYNDLSDTEIAELATKINIGADLINDIDTFLNNSNTNFLDENIIKGTNILNKIIKEDPERHEKLEKAIKEKVINMSKNVNTRIGNNEYGNIDYYRNNEKMLIQLRANVCYGEDLIIDGKRGGIFKVDGTNTGKTNMYIYKLEFETRSDVISRIKFNNLLNIPNIDKKLEGLSNESRDNIMRDFLTFFFKIKQPGMFFENKIGDEDLENIFDCFVNAEAFKNMPMERFIYEQKNLYTREYINKKGENFNEEEYQTGLKELENKLRTFRTPKEYYLAVANGNIETLLEISQGNIDRNHALYMQDIYEYIQELATLNSTPNNELNENIQQRKQELYNKIFMSEKYNKLPEEVKRSVLLMLNSDNTIENINNITQRVVDENIYRTYSEDPSKRNLKIEGSKYLLQLNDHSRHEINNSAYNNILKIKSGELRLPGRLTYILTKNNKYYPTDNTFVICVAIEKDDKIIYREINTTYEGNMGVTLLTVPKIELDKFNTYSNLNIGGQVNEIIEQNNQRYSALENDIDIINQYNGLKNNKKYEITGSDKVTRDEYAKRWPDDATCNRNGHQGILHNYSRPQSWSEEYKDLFVPKDIHKIKIPGCGDIVVRIEENEYTSIEKNLKSKKCIIKDYKSIITSGYTLGNCDLIQQKRSNEKTQNLLTLNDLAIVEEAENGEIVLKDLNGNEIKRIDQDTQTEITQVQNESMSILNKPEVEKLQGLWINNQGNSLTGLQREISELMKKMDNASINWGGLLGQIALAHVQCLTPFDLGVDKVQTVDNPFNENDVDRIRSAAIRMKEMGERVRSEKKDRENLKNMLKEMKNRSSNSISNEMELYIDGLYNSVCTMLDFIKPGGQLDSLASFVLNKQNVYKQTNAWEIIWGWIKKNGIVILTSIAFAVAAICAIPTGGATLAAMPYLATLLAAAAGTLGGMVGSRVGTVINEGLNNLHKEVIVVDGKQYTINYDSPTDVEMYLSGQLTGPDFWKGLGKEFIIGTASTFGFMVAGQRIGKGLMQTKRGEKLAEKIRPKAFKNANTQYTDNMFNNIINQGEKEGFLNKFAGEFIEECQEEFGEQGMDALGDATGLPILGGLASLYHSLTPSPNINVLQNNHVSFDMGFNGGAIIEGANINMTVYYESNINGQTNTNALTDLIAYYKSGGYEYNEATHTLTKINEDLKMENGEHRVNVIHLQPTNASLDARNIVASQLGQIGGFTVNHETGENFYNPEFTSLLEFKARELGLGQIKIDADGKLTLTTKDNVTLEFLPKKVEYFGGKSHRFMVSEVQARMNSNFMDLVGKTVETDNTLLQEMKTKIEAQYKTITGIEIDLTLDELQAIIDTHNMKGELGNLSQLEINAKRRNLSNVITDGAVVRFLFEAGFCLTSNVNIKPIQELKLDDIQSIINGTGKIKLESLNTNDLKLLMRKSCNMSLDQSSINTLATKINTLIDNNTSIDPNGELKIYIEYARCTAEIKTIKVTETNAATIEQRLNELQGKIEEIFKGNETMKNELIMEINRKKFETYKTMKDTGRANEALNKIEEVSTQLQSNDINNFKYRRALLEVNILRIQLGEGIGTLHDQAKEIREKTETIGGRTDTETLISKIESGILIGKSVKELQPYLDFLVLAESRLGVSILGATIQTLSTTFEGAQGILDDYAKKLTDTGEIADNNDLKLAGSKANEIANSYKTMKDHLENDPNGVYKNEIETRLQNFVKNRPVTSITDFGNDFTHQTILLNPQSTKTSPVMSIEIGDVDYRVAKDHLESIGVNLDGSWTDFNGLMTEFNEKVDARIREHFGTDNLQELNSSEHRALFDYIAAKFMEGRRGDQNASLSNLSQIMGIKGLQDCRLHAFTKQLFFDTRKMTQLQNLESSKQGKSQVEIEAINKKIKLIENTKMTFIDASFSGNVDMNNMYVARTQNGHMTPGSQNNVIEEHTFNLIEIPILDGSGNIQYNSDGTIMKKICYADSFYQGSQTKENGDSGKVYNLSYTGEDIGHEFIGEKGQNIHMTTTVIGSDGNPILITVTPLGRSIQGRGGNIEGSNIETRGPDGTEINTLNNLYEEGTHTIEILNKNKAEIKKSLDNELKRLQSGEIVDLTGVFESNEGHKVTERQATQIKRAFELFDRVPLGKRAIAIDAIQKMISNFTTQNEIDYVSGKTKNIKLDGKTRNATEFLQTEGVFFVAMQVFNDVYKTEIEEAKNQLDPNNPDSIRRLQDAIRNYQEIINTDMSNFFERSQQAMINDGKRGSEYHRNNFEKVARRFKNDTELYNQVVVALEQLGLNNEAFELRQEIKNQYKKLLENGQELLGHLINSDSIKSELKGPQGREIYAKLLSIREKINRGEIVDFDEEIGPNSQKFREIFGIKGKNSDGYFDYGWSKETIDHAIAQIETSGLAEYYNVIGLVYNPEIEQMLMEDAVYGSIENGYYHTEADGYVTESQNSYHNRIKNQIETEAKINSGEITINEALFGEEGLLRKNPVLDEASKAQINDLMTEMMNEFGDIFKGDKIQEYRFYKAATESIIFQTMESDTRSMGDHGINHITGNIKRLSSYLQMEANAGNIKGDIKELQFLGYITHIFHDNGYAALISQGANHRKGSDLHPFTSKMYFDQNIKPLLEGLGINTTLISQSIESHDGIHLDFSSDVNIFLSYVNISDNMALGLDKVPILWRHPKILNEIGLLYQWSKYGMNLEEGINVIKGVIDSEITDVNEREALKSAISELNRRSFENVDFLSIHPRGDCKIGEDGIRRINMYKASTFDMAAEICGLDINELKEIIEKGKEAIRTGDSVKIKEVTEELADKISKDKFGNQIIKPLKDYQDNHVLANQEGKEYPKVPKEKDGKTYYEYNRDIIAADLLIGRKVQIQNGVKAESNSDYVLSSGTTVVEYSFNENNEIPNNLKDGGMDIIESQMTEYRNGIITNEQSSQIESIGEFRQSAETLLQAIKDKKTDITTEVEGLKDSIGVIQSGSIFNNVYKEELNEIVKELNEFVDNDLKGPTYIYADIETKLKKIKSKTEGLIQYLIVI